MEKVSWRTTGHMDRAQTVSGRSFWARETAAPFVVSRARRLWLMRLIREAGAVGEECETEQFRRAPPSVSTGEECPTVLQRRWRWMPCEDRWMEVQQPGAPCFSSPLPSDACVLCALEHRWSPGPQPVRTACCMLTAAAATPLIHVVLVD